MGDIKALENSTFLEFCSFINSYLERVELINKEVEKIKNKNPKRRVR